MKKETLARCPRFQQNVCRADGIAGRHVRDAEMHQLEFLQRNIIVDELAAETRVENFGQDRRVAVCNDLCKLQLCGRTCAALDRVSVGEAAA